MPEQAAPAGSAHRYRWGRLFARSAVVCALVCLAAGLAAAVLQLALLRAALVAAGTHSAVEFSGDLEALRGSCARAAETVRAGFGPGAVPPLPTAAFPDAIRGPRDLAAARTALAAYERYVADLKAAALASYTEASDWLTASLTRKAEKIRQKLEEEHSTEAATLEARIEQLRRQLDTGGDGLYEALDQAERQRRMDVLDQATGFLQVLGSLGGGEAVQARLTAATDALEHMRATIPEPSPEGHRLRLVQQVADLRRTLSSLLKDGHKLEGEELAGRLRTIRLEVAAAVQSSWAVDADLKRLRERLNAEAVALAAVEQERTRLWRWGLAKTGGLLLVAVGAALLMRVVADVLSALFDAAEALQKVCPEPGAPPEIRGEGTAGGPPAHQPPTAAPKRRHYLRDA